MVSVVHALPASGAHGDTLKRLGDGLAPEGKAVLARAFDLAASLYGERQLGTGEGAFEHATGVCLILTGLGLDLDTRVAALLFAAYDSHEESREKLSQEFGPAVAALVGGLHRLGHLRPLTRAAALGDQGGEKSGDKKGPAEIKAQAEILRKMLLAMADDIRVVMLRLASRTQTLRWLTDKPKHSQRHEIAQESMEIYAPLANRLGVWQVKWELEDLAFRFLEPDTYKHIAKKLDEKRAEREAFIASAVARIQGELEQSGVKGAEVYGRPKHIYSIRNKMRQKDLDFEQVYDVRAMRVIVEEIKDCYTALGIVHALWQPIHGEFDDYISHPKGNNYRSLHTAVMAEDGRSLEVQIRTREMHQHAELGVAAHWRYKESGTSAKADSAYDDKIAWLRQLLSWRDEITDSDAWVEQFKRASLDDTIYVMTPQGRVIDLAKGATPIDFAYRVHTDLGHRCRGARIDGHLVPLNTPLQSGQRLEIVTSKTGGPSRDWLSSPGYLATSRARQKVKQWFADQQEAEMLAQGRAVVTQHLQREGATQSNLDELAGKLGFKNADAMYLAAARGEVGPRAVHVALHGEETPTAEPEIHTGRSRVGSGGILVVGVDKLMTQLGRCCKPAPPDAIAGFVTKGKGISVHRVECQNFRNMVARNPERIISAEWGGGQDASVYAVDILVEAADRQGLLRDISEVLSKERINVTAVRTQSKAGAASMGFTVEISSVEQLQRTLTRVTEVPGVLTARRG